MKSINTIKIVLNHLTSYLNYNQILQKFQMSTLYSISMPHRINWTIKVGKSMDIKDNSANDNDLFQRMLIPIHSIPWRCYWAATWMQSIPQASEECTGFLCYSPPRAHLLYCRRSGQNPREQHVASHDHIAWTASQECWPASR